MHSIQELKMVACLMKMHTQVQQGYCCDWCAVQVDTREVVKKTYYAVIPLCVPLLCCWPLVHWGFWLACWLCPV